jgi:beta-N-acetylhexosaminidase
VVRIPEDLPGQSELSAAEVCPTYLERSELLRKNGINLNFGIIADVTNDLTSFISERVFRDEVNTKITDAVQCTTETLSTLKHFPGHGITTDDSHVGVVSVNIDREERESTHLPPFVAGIEA